MGGGGVLELVIFFYYDPSLFFLGGGSGGARVGEFFTTNPNVKTGVAREGGAGARVSKYFYLESKS